MGEWSIYGKDGQVKATVKNLEYNGEFMGDRSITATLYSPSPISLEIGDYITYRNEIFSIDYDPSVLKQARNDTYGQGYVYDSVKFNSRQMELVFCKFLDYVIADNQVHYSSQPNFSFYCETIRDLTDRIQVNLNRLYTGGNAWTIILNSENVHVSRINIDVNRASCWDALGLIAEKFKSTFVIRGRVITVAPSTNVLDGLYQYGKGNGLRTISRTSDSSQGIVTRLRAMGNTTNMPYNYYRNKDMYVYAPITEVLGPYETSADIHTTYDFNSCFTVKAGTSSDIQYRTKVSLDKINWAPAIFSANPATVGYSVASVMQLPGYDPVQYAAFMSELNTGTYTKLYFETGISKDKWPSTYKEYTGSLGVTTGENRLMLPDYPDTTTDPYIDSANISKYGIREESVIFDGSNGLDDIFPTIQGMTAEQARAAGATIDLDAGDNGHLDEIVSATQIADDGIPPVDGEEKEMAETFNITLKDIGFDINDYLTTENATISMRDGKCEGREFEIDEVTKSGNKYVLKCKRTLDDSLNRYFPYNDYNLTSGDKYVLLHIEMPGLYVDAAAQRLEDAAEAYLAEIDHTIYTIEPKIDNIKAKRNDDAVEATGTGVKVYDTIYEGMLMHIEDSDLDIDEAVFIDHLTINEGDETIPHYDVVLRNEKVKTTVQQIQQQITDIKINGTIGGNGSVDASQVNQLIKNYGDSRYLSKVNNDRSKGKITFEKGLQIGPNFASGIAGGVGGNIDQNANAELESLVLRRFLQVPELRYNRVMVELGDKWNAPGAGIIEEVTPDEDSQGNVLTTGTCKLKLEEGEIGAVSVGDICMGIFHSETTPSMNATADSDDGKGNFQFAGFYTCYFRITSVSNAEGKLNNQYFTYALRPSDGTGGSWNKAWHPSEAMHFVVYGSFTDTTRQTSVYTTRTYTRLLHNQNTWEFSASNIGLQYGDMSNLSIFGIDMSGYSIYLNNVYFTGTIRQVDPQGHTIITANDRGAYVAGTTYAYYDRVSTDKGLWLCVNENGTNTAPSESNSDWLLQVPAGESLNPEGAWDISKVPYAYNSVVTYADRVWVANKDTSDVPYDTVHEIQSPDWDLLIDISGITDGEDGASLEVQYSADGTNWHSTFASNDIYMRQRVGDGAWSGAIRVVGEAGEDGDYKDFQFAKNTSTTTAPTSGWQDAPPSVSNGEYLWMRVRWVYGDGRQPSAWTVTRIKGDKGDDGESPLFLDFDNEYIQVACVSGTSYKADGAQTKQTGLTLFYGTHSCAISSILINGSTSYSQNGITISTNYSTSTITFTITDQAIVSERTFEFSVTGTYDGQTYVQSGKVKLRGMPAAADGSPAILYELEPSVNVIAKYKDDTLSINSISCKVIKFVGSNRSETDEKTLRYQIDGGSITTISNRSTWSQATSAITQHITFYLYDGNVLIDKERVPLVTDGKDGDGFSLAGAWSSTHGVYAKMSVVYMGGASFVAMNDTSNPPMWCYKLSDGSYAKLSDGGYALTGEVNTTDWEMLSAAPNAPLDSISDEFIFKNSTTKPAKPTSQNTDDYVPSGWTDDPVGVSISFPTEWVCKRTRRNGVWGEYSDPAVFAQFGKDGGFKSRVFLRTNNAPTTPTGGTYNNPIPNGWSDGIPSGTAILWSSVCTFNADGTSSGWSTPSAETDTDTLDIEFSPSTTEPSAPSGSTPYADHESEGWYDPNSPNFAGKDYIWRAERKVSNGVYDGAWTITRIKGEKGDSNVIADLDNEVQSIACDSTGKATAAYTLTTNVGMWYGTQELTLSSITNTTATNVTITPNAAQKKVTFAIAKNAVIAEVNNITLTLQAVHNSVTYTRTLVFTLNGVRGGADGNPATIYELVPSVSSVKKDKNGNLSVISISCTRQKTVGSTITNNTTDGAFTYSVNGGSEQSYTNNQSITIQATTTRIQFYLRINSVLVDTETIHVLVDGSDGESVIFADIDNEVQSIACTSAGKATKAYTLTTTVSMWHGLTELTLSNVTWNTISGITVSRSGKILTFSIANAATIAEVNKFNISVSASYNGQTYSKSLAFTINGVRGGADGTPATIYDLVPSASSVKRDKSGTHTPSTISCTRQKTVGTTITNNTTDGTFTYSVNGGTEQSYTNNTNITITSTMKTIAFFFKISGTLVDKETISVIEDGTDGNSVAISNQSVTYQVGNSGTTAPTGTWQATVPTVAQGKYLWTKTVVTYDDGTSTTAYSVSRAASDGANGTSITITNTSVTYAVTNNGTQPADSAFTYNSFPSVEVGKFYWVKTVVTYSDSTSTKSYSVGRVGSDGEDGLPGAPGSDGRTTYLHMAYANSADGRTDFSRTYFAGALYIGTYTDFTQTDSTSYSAYEWKRLKGEDGAGFNHRGDWASGMTLATNDVVTMGGGTYVARHDNVTAPPLSTYLLSNGDRIKLSDGGYALNGQLNTTDYWVMVARPEDGADGTDFEFIFRLTATEDSKPSKPSSPQTDDYVPSGWTDDATGISETYRAEWFCMRKKENGIWSDYSNPALWSRYAEDGEDGENAVIADLDNEMDAVTINESGLTVNQWTLTTNVMLLNGASSIPISSITFEKPTGVTCTANTSTGACTITIPSGTNIGEKAEVKITLNGTLDGASISRVLTFTIKGVVGGVVYRLIPMYNAISKSASGTITPSSSFPVRIQKIVNGVVSNAGNGEAVIYYSIDGGSYNACQNYQNPWWQIPITNTVNMVGIQARLAGTSTVIDEETIHTVDDGAKGADGKGVDNVLRYFRLSNSDTSLTGSGTGYSWSTTKPTRVVGTYIWACDVTKYTDGTYIYTNDSTYNTLTKWCNQYCFCLTGAAGDEGDRGPYIYQSKWEEDPSTMQYKAQGDADYVNCVYYNDLWYICKLSHTHASNKPPTNTTYWTEMTNMKYVATEVILAQKGSIELFQSMSVKVLDEQQRAAMIIDAGGIEQRVYADASATTPSGFMRFTNGTLGYYNANNEAIWEIGASGTTTFFNPSKADGWRTWRLHYLGTNESTAKANAKQVAAYSTDNNTYYEVTSVLSNSYSSNIGMYYITQVVHDGIPISDGYYCISSQAMQKVSFTETTVYFREVFQFSSGRKINSSEVTWNVI